MDISSWYWPQWFYIFMTIIGLCILSNQHGKPKTGVHNIWISIIATTPIWACLYFGGFFK